MTQEKKSPKIYIVYTLKQCTRNNILTLRRNDILAFKTLKNAQEYTQIHRNKHQQLHITTVNLINSREISQPRTTVGI